ncbi:MAG: hypothetical protein AABX10_03500 [Nanoarchaeota archaeon]
MEQKLFLFTSIPLLGVILIFGYLNIQQESPSSSLGNEICKQIVYNGYDRIDLLFISSKEDAKHYSDYLFTVEPYKSYKNYFNVNVLEEEVECDYYKDIAILCHNDQVLDLAKNCEHDYVIVVKEDSKQIRSSTYGKIVSLNKAHEDSVLIHELGHIFNLAEEYLGAKIPKGSKNCQQSCSGFDSEVDACTQECSTATHYRSIPLGVMRSLVTDNYGIYNTKLISEILNENKPRDLSIITGNQVLDSSCNKKALSVDIYQLEDGFNVVTDNVLEDICIPDKGLAGPLCFGNICNINLLFTDSQDISSDETLNGETFVNADIPLKIYLEKNENNPIVDITFDGQIISSINTAEAGATACTI